MAWTLTVGARQIQFGCELDGLGLMRTPHVKPIVDLESYANPRGDGRRNGRMYRRGQAVSLDVEARPDHRTADEVWRELLSVWRADEIRFEAGKHAYLTSDTGRVAVGMPVEIDPNQEYRIFDMNRAELTFEAVDDLWYGPEEVTEISFAPPVGGGLRFPARSPFRFNAGPSVRNGSVVVSGDVACSPVLEIRGPVSNPEIDIVGLGKLQFRVALASDQRLVVDTRHWARWVKRGYTDSTDLAAFPGALSPSGLRLSDVVLRPGAYQVLLRGFDPTGTAKLRVLREPAFTSY